MQEFVMSGFSIRDSRVTLRIRLFNVVYLCNSVFMRILLIEDDQDIAELVKPSLEAECFSVDIAVDGERGAYLGKINDYDLVILDNMLPKKMGLDVCRELRAASRTMPILILSVVSDTPKKVELLNAGADDYLTKPFSFVELSARIHSLLRRPKQIQEEKLIVGDLVVETRSARVCRGRKQIYLTRKEFMLLAYLMRHKGFVLSRGQIMEHVWDMDADPFSNTIEAHIRALRKKIESPDKKKLIFTFPGRGYKIDG